VLIDVERKRVFELVWLIYEFIPIASDVMVGEPLLLFSTFFFLSFS
jgi:hypothetical protein